MIVMSTIQHCDMMQCTLCYSDTLPCQPSIIGYCVYVLHIVHVPAVEGENDCHERDKEAGQSSQVCLLFILARK